MMLMLLCSVCFCGCWLMLLKMVVMCRFVVLVRGVIVVVICVVSLWVGVRMSLWGRLVWCCLLEVVRWVMSGRVKVMVLLLFV